MNKQVGYITSAHLVLAAIIGSCLLISKIPLSTDRQSTITYDLPVTQTPPTIPVNVAIGKTLFSRHCASCHSISKRVEGPRLSDFEERGPWIDRNKVYEWIRNPAAFMQKDLYARELKRIYGSMMTAFPALTDDEIDAIVDYIKFRPPQPVAVR